MNAYTLSIVALLFAAVAQTSATWIAVERLLALKGPIGQRIGWAAMAAANVLLTLQQAYVLERALRTSLYDLRQALLAAAVAGCLVLAAVSLKSRSA